jgi:hypothetical protein
MRSGSIVEKGAMETPLDDDDDAAWAGVEVTSMMAVELRIEHVYGLPAEGGKKSNKNKLISVYTRVIISGFVEV